MKNVCGICGFIHHDVLNEKVLERMNSTIRYRGPDDKGVFSEIILPFTEQGRIVQVGLAHNRLSVLDLSELGHQPMFSSDGRLVVCYNGEIYNYREIRECLISKGYEFKSNCDTEVILCAYQEWGIRCVENFNGMFAFALWDRQQKTFFLVRDRMGVKPLYYYLNNGTLVFGSELKPIMEYPVFSKDINFSALSDYLPHQYITGPASVFNNTWKLEPGHILCLNIDDMGEFKITDECYWSVEEVWKNREEWQEDYDTAKERLHSLLLDAVKLRMVSDVPVGAFLSGGYDSSLVTALMTEISEKRIKTFSIGFEEPGYDESIYASRVAKYLGTEHTCEMLPLKEAKAYIECIPDYYDEPMADASQVATMMLSKITRNEVTVALSGDAGDELFCGYNKYCWLNGLHRRFNHISRLINRANIVMPLRKMTDILDEKRLPHLYYMNTNERAMNAYAYIFWERYKSLLPPAHRISDKYKHAPAWTSDFLMGYMLMDMVTYLPDDIMVKVDRAAMAVSLETRAPLLDYRVIESAISLPLQYKLNDGNKKRILKDIAYDYIPKRLLDRPKQGFGVPVVEWMHDDFLCFTRGLLERDYIKKQGIFDVNAVGKMVDEFKLSPDMKNGNEIWSMLVFQLWWECYMK